MVDSEFLDGTNIDKYGQEGLTFSFDQSTGTINNCNFFHVVSKKGPAVYALDIPESSTTKNVKVYNSNLALCNATESGGAIFS